MLSHKRNIRILLLGEPQTGKTTLVLSLVSEEFPPKVPARAEEITIPAEVTPERILTQIVDFSARVQTQDELIAEVRRADVVCLVHALDDSKSLQQIPKFWLPLIRHASADSQVSTPVVIVGNKLDLIDASQLDNVLPIMSEFLEVETCIECSAKTLLNLSETFWFAQKAVLYPTAPLYNAERRELTADCIHALTRIFRICDTDNDGYLSDRELEAFQSRCFSVPLTAQSLQDVKQLIRQSCPGGLTLSGVTQKGFLFLHLIFIQKGRHETTWTVLRQFGYDNQIRLSSEFLSPKLSVPPGCSTEISPLGFHFLQTLFSKYDLDRDDCLSPRELAELLSTCPNTDHPLRQVNTANLTDRVATNSLGWLTRQGFLAHWILSAYLEPSQALEYLAYLGFTYFAADTFWSSATPGGALNGDRFDCYDQSGAGSGGGATVRRRVTRSESGLQEARGVLLRGLLVTPEKRVDAIRRSTNRTVFYCRVYGARKVGKTCLLQGLLGRYLHGSGGLAIGGLLGRASNLAAAYGLPVYGQPRSLLLHEIDPVVGEKMTASEALRADVACLVYDVSDPESFRYVANLFLAFYRGTGVPCLFVASKSDQPHTLQNYPMEPEALTVKYNLTPPMYFSSLHLGQQLEDAERAAGGTGGTYTGQQHRESRSSLAHEARRRAGSLEPSQHLSEEQTLLEKVGDKATGVGRGLTGLSSNSEQRRSHEDSDVLPRGGSCGQRRASQPVVTNSKADALASSAYFAPVYIQLATLANYPHLRGLQVSTTDQAWKWTLAATVLAGFGFVAFRIVRTHF